MPQLVDMFDVDDSEPITCAENNSFLPIASVYDDLNLISSLNTLGYIKFDVLCNLNNLEKKLSFVADLSWLSKNSYHIIGKYDSKGEYMVHRVYISSNLAKLVDAFESFMLHGLVENKYVISSIISLKFRSVSCSFFGYYLEIIL